MAGFAGLSVSNENTNTNSHLLSKSKQSTNRNNDNKISEIVLEEPEANLKFGISIFKSVDKKNKTKDLIIKDTKPNNIRTINNRKGLEKEQKKNEIVKMLDKKETDRLRFYLFFNNKSKDYIIVDIPKEKEHTQFSKKNIEKYEYILVTYRIAPILLREFLNKIFLKNSLFNFKKTFQKFTEFEFIDGENKIKSDYDIKKCRSVMKFDNSALFSFMTIKNFNNFLYISDELKKSEKEKIRLYSFDPLLGIRGKQENTIDIATFNIFNNYSNNNSILKETTLKKISQLSGNMNLLINLKDGIIYNIIVYIPSLSKKNGSYISHGLDDLLLMFFRKILTKNMKQGNRLLTSTNNRKIGRFNTLLPDTFDIRKIIDNNLETKLSKAKSNTIKSKHELKPKVSKKKSSKPVKAESNTIKSKPKVSKKKSSKPVKAESNIIKSKPKVSKKKSSKPLKAESNTIKSKSKLKKTSTSKSKSSISNKKKSYSTPDDWEDLSN